MALRSQFVTLDGPTNLGLQFAISKMEPSRLRSQFVTSKTAGRGGRRYAPHVFLGIHRNWIAQN